MRSRLRLEMGLAILAGPGLFAQAPPPLPPPDQGPGKAIFFHSATGGGERNFTYVTSGMRIEGEVVKNAPYSAQAVTETKQILSDGNRISRKSTASVYRDSEGRTRREDTLGFGPQSGGEQAQTIFINDPVAESNVVLDTRSKIAHRMPNVKFAAHLPEGATGAAGGAIAVSDVSQHMAKLKAEAEVNVMMGPGVMISGPNTAVAFSDKDAKKESLGTEMIEGVQAEGTRTTMTIPAGQIGNDLPIQIVSERWYSPELHTVVMSKHNDPRMGETVYRLTGINRSEPARNLFEVPADYTVQK